MKPASAVSGSAAGVKNPLGHGPPAAGYAAAAAKKICTPKINFVGE